MQPIAQNEAYRDSISTVDEQGKRVWVYPRKPKGKLFNARVVVAIVLLAVLFGVPFVKIGGQPLFLFNIFERKFVLLGYPFFPQDFHLLGLAMITFFVFIILFTVVFGRVWCGWACPQTIFMELVFRRIEYWIEGDASAQKALDKAPWTKDKLIKKSGKHLIFLLISVVIAHTVMAYLIGVEGVQKIVSQSPLDNLAGFTGLVMFTGIFYLVFAKVREQVCIVVCPYGRLQGVLLIKETIVVAYDFIRGEPRGKIKKSKVKPATTNHSCTGSCLGCTANHSGEHRGTVEDAKLTARPLKMEDLLLQQGDCIDCKMCVQVCPTGIDIRNGLQLECVNCTACIDACDAVMTKIGKPTGLIRFDSYKGITEKTKLRVTPRMVAYSLVLIALLGLQGFLLTSRNEIQATLLRVPGMLYQQQPGGMISNLYEVKLVNKTLAAVPLTLKLREGTPGKIKMVGGQIIVPEGGTAEAVFFIELPKQSIKEAKTALKIELYSGGKLMETVKTNFLGPVNE